MICDVTDRRVDGCYGWIVVLSGFCLIVLTDGILFTFGNLLIELTEYFDADRARIALIGALMLGFSCLTGPISGGLCDRFGCRMVAVTGSVLSSVSLLISSFATNVTYLYLTYGVLGGTGVGFMYLSANVIAVQYFDKHRGLACGITLCGSGIASTIGRAVLGWFGDRQYVNKIMLVSVLLLLLGLSTMLSCFLKTFSTLVIYSSIYGFFAGGYIALCPTVLAELFSAELIARSFGLYFLFIGISSTAATPIGGFLYDTTGSYDVTFVVAGAELLTAGVLIMVLRCVHVHYV